MHSASFLDRIAARASHITTAIEATGKSLTILDKASAPQRFQFNDRGGAFLEWGARQATIWADLDQPLHHIFHALLHLHRYWVAGVPQFWDQKRGCEGMLYEAERNFEHLVVIPVEITYFPEAFGYWVFYAEKKLFEFERDKRSRGNLRTKLFQLYLLAQAAFPCSQVADSITAAVRGRGLMDEFTELAGIIFKNYHYKAFVLESLCLYGFGDVPTSVGVRWMERQPDEEGEQVYWASLKDYQTLRELPSLPLSLAHVDGSRIETTSVGRSALGPA